MGSFGRQLPGVNVVWRDEVRLKWNFWLENVFKWKGSRQLCTDGVGGWLWANACCCTDHHLNISTAHRSCYTRLLFNLIPAHLLQDHFMNDPRTILRNFRWIKRQYIKTQPYSEEFWNSQSYGKGNILTEHITHINQVSLQPLENSRWSFSCSTNVRKCFERFEDPPLSCENTWGRCAPWLIRWWWSISECQHHVASH